MALKGKLIRINSGGARASTMIGINGRHRRIPHNRDTPVSQAELELLENSRVQFVVVGDAKAKQLDKAVDANTESTAFGDTDPTSAEATPAGADILATQPPVIPVATRTRPPEDETPAGADHLAPTEPVTGATIEDARQDALAAQQAAAEGTTEPAIILTNNDPDQSKAAEMATNPEGAAESPRSSPSIAPSLNREPFSPEAMLDQPVSKITEDIDRLSDDQVRRLLDAERDGKNRGRLVVALEARLR